MELTQIITELPVVGALLVLVLMFLRHLKAQREDFKETINNHIHENRDATKENTSVLIGLKDIMKEVSFYIKKANGNRRQN